ncbi:hypothetical protein Q1695_015556 [Nippostrongylus brasiliensis]|nr:hypothetical protein Q1695_015556 [Nippostrongylus brasiliensis]
MYLCGLAKNSGRLNSWTRYVGGLREHCQQRPLRTMCSIRAQQQAKDLLDSCQNDVQQKVQLAAGHRTERLRRTGSTGERRKQTSTCQSADRIR